jgi:hypothetical protein
MDDEHYIDGQHNGGVFNHFNHNSYGYCYQNPIKYVDPNGKQSNVTENVFVGPNMHRNIFEKGTVINHQGGTKETTYKLTRPSAYMFSLVTETGYENIKNTTFKFRTYKNGGGGLTTGENSKNGTITYFNIKKRSSTSFLDLTAHELGHVSQLDEAGGAKHITRSIIGYVKAMIEDGNDWHEKAELEQRAEQGAITFRDFSKFVDDYYGNGKENMIEKLFNNSENKETDITNRLTRWWNKYINETYEKIDKKDVKQW